MEPNHYVFNVQRFFPEYRYLGQRVRQVQNSSANHQALEAASANSNTNPNNPNRNQSPTNPTPNPNPNPSPNPDVNLALRTLAQPQIRLSDALLALIRTQSGIRSFESYPYMHAHLASPAIITHTNPYLVPNPNTITHTNTCPTPTLASSAQTHKPTPTHTASHQGTSNLNSKPNPKPNSAPNPKPNSAPNPNPKPKPIAIDTSEPLSVMLQMPDTSSMKRKDRGTKHRQLLPPKKKNPVSHRIVTFMVVGGFDFESVVRVVGLVPTSSDKYRVIEMKSNYVWEKQSQWKPELGPNIKTVPYKSLRPVDERVKDHPNGIGQMAMVVMAKVCLQLAGIDAFAELISETHELWSAIPSYEWWMERKSKSVQALFAEALPLWRAGLQEFQVNLNSQVEPKDTGPEHSLPNTTGLTGLK